MSDDTELDEVIPHFPNVTSSPKLAPDASDENLPEIVVQAHPIPWWVWASVGLFGALVVSEFLKKR